MFEGLPAWLQTGVCAAVLSEGACWGSVAHSSPLGVLEFPDRGWEARSAARDLGL